MTNTHADQADVLADLEQARADLSTANQTVGTLQAQITTLTSERDTARSEATAAIQERDALRSENATLKQQMSDFNRRLAAELSKHGIRNAEAPKAESTPAKPLTATEKVLAAKGAKSLDDLAAKRNH